MTRPIIVQGAQYGSEAKGAVAAYLCETRNAQFAVRTGAVNAGHTVYHKGKEYKMQQLPTGWTNPDTKLVIGAGAMVHPEILAHELLMLSEVDPDILDRLWIDYRAGIHLEQHTTRATEANRHHKMGATGKGCSEAIIDKIRRRGDEDYGLFSDSLMAKGLQQCFADTSTLLYEAHQRGDLILLEGTQGSHLDLHLGPYPFTTHKPCQAAQWVVEAGLPLGWDYEVILVARTYPIRVAGNSGPMPRETSWTKLAEDINRRLYCADMPLRVRPESLNAFKDACHDISMAVGAPHGALELWTDEERSTHRKTASELHKMALESLPEETVNDLKNLFEMTTVTKKLRRIAELDLGTLQQSIRWNNPTSIALTFANYWYPELWNHSAGVSWADLTPEAHAAMQELNARLTALEDQLRVPISLVSFGPESKHIIPQYGSHHQ